MGCEQLADVAALGALLEKLQALTSLELIAVLHCSGELLFGLNVLAIPHPLTVLHCNGELFGLKVGPLRQAW